MYAWILHTEVSLSCCLITLNSRSITNDQWRAAHILYTDANACLYFLYDLPPGFSMTVALNLANIFQFSTTVILNHV